MSRKIKALHYKKYYDKLNIKLKICGVGDFLHRICVLESRGMNMPIGVIINALSVAAGGVIGALFGHKLPAKINSELTKIFGICSMGMGVSSIEKYACCYFCSDNWNCLWSGSQSGRNY